MAHLTRAEAPGVVSMSSDGTVHDAAELMCKYSIGAVMVTNTSGKLVGIITERDLVNRVTRNGRPMRSVCVTELMTPDPASCAPGTTMKKAQEIMMCRRIRHLPVVDETGRIVGIISSRDVMAHQVKADRAMRDAAEQVAMLSTCLKSLDLDEVVELVTSEVPKIFGAERSVLFFGDPEKSGPLLVHRRGCPLPDDGLRDVDCGGDAVKYDDAPCRCCQLGAASPRVLVPLEIHGLKRNCPDSVETAEGFLCMCGLSEELTELADLVWYKASLIREVLNANLTNASLYQQARRDSMTDSLTEVGSRRLFEKKLEGEFTRSQRYKRPFCVAMADLDDFKSINDGCGHIVGDEVLCRFARCVEQEKREADVVARYGGDEFVLLLPETTLEGAVSLLERLRLRTQKLSMPNGLTVRVSCGVAQYEPDGDLSVEALVRCADLALYEAKRTGRNRVKAWDGQGMGREVSEEVDEQKIDELRSRLTDMSVRSKEVLVQSVWALVQALEARDTYTRNHSDNVMHYSVAIAEHMGMDDETVNVIRRAAMIHDIGKIGVPDDILGKPGKLTAEERRIMEQHPMIGVRILDQMRLLERELPIIRHHHERWDGKGYPDGLHGTAIPQGARILAVADTFDAITSERVYRTARTVQEALAILSEESGRQFEPQAVEAMLEWVDARRRALPAQDALTPEHLLAGMVAGTAAA